MIINFKSCINCKNRVQADDCNASWCGLKTENKLTLVTDVKGNLGYIETKVSKLIIDELGDIVSSTICNNWIDRNQENIQIEDNEEAYF